jgi:uncharacterized protein YndB with AHSA1/START domain
MKDLIARSSIIINAPRDKVWNALVTPTAIKQYMFGADVRSDWKEGSSITWSGEWRGKKFQDKGVILKIERDYALQYSHFSPLSGRPDKPENYHIVTIELSDAGAQTRVMLTQDNNPTEDTRSESEKNWTMMLNGLKKLVEGSGREK